jgi:thiol-disulfide isomerase/thioredoxin
LFNIPCPSGQAGIFKGRYMRKIFFVFLVVLCARQTVSAQQIKKIKIAELVKMIDTSSTPLIVSFWASWCAPCIKEIPWFEKNVAASDKKVRLVLVSIDFADDYPKTIADFVKKNGYRSEILWLNETNADEFCPKIDKSWDGAIPATVMVNNKNHYRQFFGQQLPEERFKLELAKLTGTQ